MDDKVFGIGFHKTGTTSLANALSILGYRVTGPNGAHNPNIKHDVYSMAKQLIPEFDAFQDNPWPLLYKSIDQWYPRAKFVLTIRSSKDWISSVVGHFGECSTPMREWIYGVGTPIGYEDTYIEIYKAHNQEVINYFKDRPDSLLVLRITDGEGWEKLCPFLNRSVPNVCFPNINKARDRDEPRKDF